MDPTADGLQREPLRTTLDPENFTPRLLSLLSNALVWRESNELRRRFGLGTNDWRVISALAFRPGSPATEVSEFIGVNKAVVSKSVNTLAERGLIVLLDGPRGSRPMYLTAAGVQMHDDMLPISMRGQDIVLAHLSAEEIVRVNDLLRRMLVDAKQLQVLENETAASSR
ncbi:MarR family winged helix-turn-helix transcriptional regulator [Microbacterium sp. SORGH_AS_0888]|uniref:MarR family winged helix-turn-helix transcriptional regulator n=1 Tax=Microbacterium sp. SORGH_AS_0888 TaxID=3041791 RepID=UPI002787E70F|nr:MarR family winged helix-turn-helix transcriptional regulator [Microbacterium sp. SORGH_AS_0888]MDQ1129658.1 DNA-binding MarR family transcriptional regulator [Microbacterium sp. SORGH_AS_0888]